MSERLDRAEAILLATAERQNAMNASLQQTRSALQRTQALLDQTAERQNEMNASLQRTQALLDQTAQQQTTNTSEIDTLLGAVSTNEVELRALIQQMAESNQLFEVLRQDAIADRQRSDQRFEAMQENIQRLFLELHSTNRHVDTLEQAS